MGYPPQGTRAKVVEAEIKRLDVDLSTRASEETLSAIKPKLDAIREVECLWTTYLRSPSRLGGLTSAYYVRCVDEDTIVVTTAYRVFVSRDRGRTWKDVLFIHPYVIERLHVTREGTLLVGAGYGRIYRSEDLGNTWSVVLNLNDPNVTFRTSSEQVGYIFFGAYGLTGANAGKLFRSTDDGRTWTQVLDVVSGWGERHLHAVHASRMWPGHVYATTGDTYYYLLRSTDWGATWSEYSPTGWSRHSVVSLAESHSHLFTGGDVLPFVVGRIRRDVEEFEVVLNGHYGFCWFDNLKVDDRGYVIAGESNYELNRALGSLWLSPDEGDSWFEYARFPGLGVNSIDVSPDGFIYVAIVARTGSMLVRLPLPSRTELRSIPKKYTKKIVNYENYAGRLPFTSRTEYVGDLHEGHVFVQVRELLGTSPQLTFRLESGVRGMIPPQSLEFVAEAEETVTGPFTAPGRTLRLTIPRGMVDYVRLRVEGSGTITSAYFGAYVTGVKY